MVRRLLAPLIAALVIAAGAPLAHAQEDPNYVWRTDPISKALAGKPFADAVLHRVPGSLHDAPRTAPEAAEAAARGKALIGPGTPIYVGSNAMCTVAVAGIDARGRMVALTAGHCGEVGQVVTSADAVGLGPAGLVAAVDHGLDYAVIELWPVAEVTRTYNGVSINHVGAPTLAPGQIVCKSGYASAQTCGFTWFEDGRMNLNQVCAMQGDSGAPLYSGDRLVGIINGGIVNLPCNSPLQGPIFSPTASARFDTIAAAMDAAGGPGAGFRLP
ncbi:S1 family peptidase [Corynebacterium liangguodongii]|uniref:Trypsin n=1 Tax=Corynebacterium liangguodongii TaxID=2079535 RepID=A0A2S0WCU7_9CORY|nr:S1 family peptidase [Corynebacterium liangguodongii]AWB83591.1 trypsin [Corynebacterium liangguodongii]PWB98617.1 trypsin [Corynebacterium liangguodongii]